LVDDVYLNIPSSTATFMSHGNQLLRLCRKKRRRLSSKDALIFMNLSRYRYHLQSGMTLGDCY